MLEKNYFCKYKNQYGDVVIEEIVAPSESAAVRTLILKHPLAEIMGKPSLSHPEPSLEGRRPAKNMHGKPIIWLIGGMVTICLILLSIVVFLLR